MAQDHVVDVKGKPETPGYVDLEPEVEQAAPFFMVKNQYLRECLAEFFGTFVLITFGVGVNNQVTLGDGGKGNWLSINMAWGIAVLLGVHASAGVSGAHLNPAVSVTLAVYKQMPWYKVPGYVLAQVLGAFCGALAVYCMYYELLNVYDPERVKTQGSFATYPNPNINNTTAFYTEFIGTAMLMIGILSITDDMNRPASATGTPVHLMFLIWAIGMALGSNTGYAINPARDFGPRLFTAVAGWGSKVFTVRDHYFWIPIVAPIVGGITGAGVYKIFVSNHHPRQRSA